MFFKQAPLLFSKPHPHQSLLFWVLVSYSTLLMPRVGGVGRMVVPIADIHWGQEPFSGFPWSQCLSLDAVSANGASCPAQASLSLRSDRGLLLYLLMENPCPQCCQPQRTPEHAEIARKWVKCSPPCPTLQIRTQSFREVIKLLRATEPMLEPGFEPVSA